MGLQLRETVQAKAAAQAAEAGFDSVEAYVEGLIEADAAVPVVPRDEAAVLDGLAGPGAEMTSAEWAALRDAFRRERAAAGLK